MPPLREVSSGSATVKPSICDTSSAPTIEQSAGAGFGACANAPYARPSDTHVKPSAHAANRAKLKDVPISTGNVGFYA